MEKMSENGFTLKKCMLCAEEWTRFDQFRFKKEGGIDVNANHAINEQKELNGDKQADNKIPEALVYFDLPATKGATYASKKMEEERMKQTGSYDCMVCAFICAAFEPRHIVKRIEKWVKDDEKKALREMVQNAIPTRLHCGKLTEKIGGNIMGEIDGSSDGFHYELFARALPKVMEETVVEWICEATNRFILVLIEVVQ